MAVTDACNFRDFSGTGITNTGTVISKCMVLDDFAAFTDAFWVTFILS